MITIRCCPSTLIEGHDTYSAEALQSLFWGEAVSPFLDFKIGGQGCPASLAGAMHHISVSGVQEKFPAVVDGGKIRIAEKEERSTHILKPAPWDETLVERRQVPANEHLTMQVASQVYGIDTAANGLCFAAGRPVYITRRFDIGPDGSKCAMEDMAAAVGRNEPERGRQFKYCGSYEDVANAIRANVTAWEEDLGRLFELVVFNYVYGNGDGHLKNFSLIRREDGYRLAPAYDLLNTRLHVCDGDFGLDGGLSPNIEKSDAWERTGHPCQTDFRRFGERIGLDHERVRKTLDRFVSHNDDEAKLVAHSFLTDKMKRAYIRIVEERRSMLRRASE